MKRNGEIIIIEDDEDDRFYIEEILTDLGYKDKIHFFEDGTRVLEYLRKKDSLPFLIISDINMPLVSGIELREKIVDDIGLIFKTVPYIFLSTSFSEETIHSAYNMSIQGYFTKSNNYSEMKQMMKLIIDYWKVAKLPEAL